MKKGKKVLAGLLAFVTLFSNVQFCNFKPVITAYAGDFSPSVNAGGGGSSGGTGKGVGTNTTRTLESHTAGVRLTMVDPNTGQPVSKTVDIVYSTPPNNSVFFTKCRTEDAGSSDDFSNLEIYSVTKIEGELAALGYQTSFPRWYNRASGNVHTGDGMKFRDWFCTNEGIDKFADLRGKRAAVEQGLQNLNQIDTNPGEMTQQEWQERENQSKQTSENYKIYINETHNAIGGAHNIEEVAYVFGMALSALNGSFSTDGWEIDESSRMSDLEQITTIATYKAESLGYTPERLDDEVSKLSASVIGNAAHDFFGDTGIKDSVDPYSDVKDLNDKLSGKDSAFNTVLDLFTITAHAAERDPSFDRLQTSGSSKSGSGGSGGPNSATTGLNKENKEKDTDTTGVPDDFFLDAEKTKINADKYGYAYILAQLEIGGKALFAQGSESGEVMLRKFISGDAYFVAEPILFFAPQGSRNYPQFFYGTPANYGWFSENVLVKWDPLTGGGGDIFRGPNIVFINAFDLSDDEATLAGAVRVPLTNDNPFLKGGRAPMNYGRYGTARYRSETIYEYVTGRVGMGMHIYALVGGESRSMINTYDVVNKPSHDDNSEPAPPKPPESSDYSKVNKNKTFQIVKFYRINYGNGKYQEWSYYSQENTPHTVQITDEVDIGWKLIEWYTSTSKWMPPNGGDPKKYPWESYVRGNNPKTTYEGKEETILTVKPDDPDNTLYLLYELTVPPEVIKPPVTVIRVYDDEDGHTDKVEREDTEENPYVVPTDPEYEYVETKITPNPPKPTKTWEDSEGEPKGNPPTVEYPENTRTIYIHYKKKPTAPDTQKIVLYENELSYNYSLKDLLKDRKLIEIYEYVPAPDVSYGPCTGPHHDRCNKYHYSCYMCSDSDFRLTDPNYSFTVKDSFDQNTLPFIKDWKYTSTMSAAGVSPKFGGGGDKHKVIPQATFLLIRDKQADVVTLYPKKNSSLLGELSQLNLSENYTSSDTRYQNARETDSTKRFYRTVHTQLGYSQRDETLAWKSWMTPKTHYKSGTYNTSPQSGHTPEDANSAYSKSNNVEIRYFLGKAGKGEEKPSDVRSEWNRKFERNQSYAQTEADLSFYPYLKYLYYYKDNGSPNPVMVTSSNLSGMKVFNAIQSGVYKKNDINVNLDSTQWSTHARSMSFLQKYGISDKKTVLPGGAIQDLDMGNKGDTQVGLTIWQACLPDGQVETVQEGFKVSETQARQAANDLIEAVKKSISGYGLVQWGIEGVQTTMREMRSAKIEELHENTNVSFVAGRGGKTSGDDKYYLRHDGNGSSRANFDVLDSRIENQFLYTIYSDVDGNVWVTKDGSQIGNKISKGQDASALLSNAELKLLDDNTKLITNYVACIQRNAGNSRTGEQWHNEAFDGVSVLMTDVSFDVGFGNGSSHRTNVLDPLLVALADSKSDLYNFDSESKIRSSIYLTTKLSSQAEKKDVEGYLGTLKAVAGMGDLDINLSDIESMAYTKNFYIPNATVSDLN